MQASVSELPVLQRDVDIEVETLIIGAGACGLVAALSAIEAGQNVLVIEADPVPSGSTALSAGLIPAAGTRLQKEASIHDSATLFAQDIQTKAGGENSSVFVTALAGASAEVIHWLIDKHNLAFSLVDNFDYPGHSRRRMHGLPSRAGRELLDALRSACDKKNVDIVCRRRAYLLHKNGLQINAVGVIDPSGVTETIGCKKLILACNGFGGNRQLVSQHLPSISEGMWFGHDGNQGEAVLWAQQLGASLKHLGAFQGHGNVAHPHGILITWAVITQGGVQVNIMGKRFWDESQGYSEAARAVLAQPEGKAVTIFDERIAQVARQFEDFRQAESVHAVVKFNTLIELAEHFALPIASLEDSLSASTSNNISNNIDEFGRRFCGPGLSPPYYAVRVTGALFHTQGGLEVDEQGRVRHESGQLFSNLYAGGGAACGVSGEGDSGYLSGNGLLSAVVLGYRAGKA